MLDKDTPIPLYYQLKEKLTEAILRGDWPAGMMIPSERELSETYGISRMTVRQALMEMVNEGLLVRKKGIGTYVSAPKITQDLMRLTSFSEDMNIRGLHPRSLLKSVQIQEASKQIAEHLGLRTGEEMIVIERLRLADELPMAFEVSHLPFKRFKGLEQKIRTSQSLYQTLEESYQVEIEYAKQSLEAVNADVFIAKTLHITSGAPVLLIQRTTHDKHHGAFEYVRSYYRADRYKFVVELKR